MFTYGLVFRLHEEVWLGLYDDDGNILDAEIISDEDGIYEDLAPNAISFVSAEVEDELSLRDLQTITIEHPDYTGEEALPKMLEEGYFPEFAKSVWEEWGH